MLNQFSRTQLLFGKEAMERLYNAHVAVFGVGGVGGYTVEALARSGIGTLDLIDVKTADLAAQNLARTQPEIEELYRTKVLLREILERGDAFSLRDLAIGGKELLALGYQGKAIGGALDALLSGVIAGEAENDRAALLHYLAALNLPKSE